MDKVIDVEERKSPAIDPLILENKQQNPKINTINKSELNEQDIEE